MTALARYMLPYQNEDSTAVNSFAGIPVYTSKFVERGKVYLTNNYIMTNSIDTILMPVLLKEVRQEATRIVQWGLSDVRAWLGEIPADEVACNCTSLTDTPDYFSPGAHYVKDHKYDCNGWTPEGPPCGGCYACLAMQVHYYATLEE